MKLFFIDPIQRYMEALLEGRKPKRFKVGNQEDLDALKMAALLSAAGHPEAERPDSTFVARLQRQLMERAPETHTSVNRRGFLAAGLSGLAAGLAAGVGIDRWKVQSEAPTAAPRTSSRPMVRDNGRWFPVARLSELGHDAVVRFSAGALEGHLVKVGDNISAVSAICSHLPCTLVYQQKADNFLCPCHNATFTKAGDARAGSSYGPLTKIQVSVKEDQVLVWSIDAAPPPPPPPADVTSAS